MLDRSSNGRVSIVVTMIVNVENQDFQFRRPKSDLPYAEQLEYYINVSGERGKFSFIYTVTDNITQPNDSPRSCT